MNAASLNDVAVSFGNTQVLEGVNLELRAGTVTGVYGPSGSGKSTLLAVASGRLKPTQGSIAWSADGDRTRRQLRSAWIPQSPLVLPGRTVLDNVLLAHHICHPQVTPYIVADALRHLDEVGLAPLAQRNANVLSGGEMQRLAIVRARLAPTPLIVADEPTGALDLRNSSNAIAALVAARGSQAILIATHDETIARWCDELYYLDSGHLTLRRGAA